MELEIPWVEIPGRPVGWCTLHHGETILVRRGASLEHCDVQACFDQHGCGRRTERAGADNEAIELAPLACPRRFVRRCGEELLDALEDTLRQTGSLGSHPWSGSTSRHPSASLDRISRTSHPLAEGTVRPRGLRHSRRAKLALEHRLARVVLVADKLPAHAGSRSSSATAPARHTRADVSPTAGADEQIDVLRGQAHPLAPCRIVLVERVAAQDLAQLPLLLRARLPLEGLAKQSDPVPERESEARDGCADPNSMYWRKCGSVRVSSST